MSDLVMCDHHEWFQALPIRENILVCSDCGTKAPMLGDDKRAARCPMGKIYKAGSGWRGVPFSA